MSVRSGVFLGLGGLSALVLVGLAAPAKAKRVQTMPVSEVRPGMRGHAVTVFSGTQTDRFEIEVIDVVPHYLPKQDAVLFKSNDPRLLHSGIVGGMSGSPIFIEGKLVGALAYGWPFNKDPMGGLTPIENMQAVGELPYRPDVLPHPGRGRTRQGTRAWADAMLGLETSPLPARRRADDVELSNAMAPLGTPLSVGGMGVVASRMLGDAFGMIPVRGGSRGSAPAGSPGAPQGGNQRKGWDFGDAVSVVLIDGDSAVAGNGTVTWVSPKGDRLLAFGHSMFEDGPTNVPMAHAKVHTIINSVQRSVKLSSSLEIDGLMYQDRQAAIALRTDLRAPMIPVSTNMKGPDPDLPARSYDNRVAFGRELTPNLVASILAEAVDEAGRDAVEVVFQIKSSIELETGAGTRTLEIEEEVFFGSGLIGRALGRSRGVLTLLAALDNDFEVAQIHGVRHDITMSYGAPLETIEAISLPTDQVRAGEIVDVSIELRSYKGDLRVETLPIRVPTDAAGEEILIEVAGGDAVRPYRPRPLNLDDLLTTVVAAYPSRAMVASIYRQSEGISTRQGLISDVPDSVLETLVARGSTRDSIKFKQLSRRVIPTKKIIQGMHSIKVDVLSPTSF